MNVLETIPSLRPIALRAVKVSVMSGSVPAFLLSGSYHSQASCCHCFSSSRILVLIFLSSSRESKSLPVIFESRYRRRMATRFFRRYLLKPPRGWPRPLRKSYESLAPILKSSATLTLPKLSRVSPKSNNTARISYLVSRIL